MYLLFGIFGGIWGARLAKKRGGKTLDILQYSAGYFLFYAIIFAVILIPIYYIWKYINSK